VNFALTDDQAAVRETFREFARKSVAPLAADLDENPRFPRELLLEAGELGLFGMRYPEPDGLGMDVLSYTLAIEEIAAASLAVAASCTMQSLMGLYFVQRFAAGELRERLLPGALRGETIGTICMSEPGAGSDLLGLTTRADQVDGKWLVTGQKTWITSAPVADMFTVLARTGEKELSLFLVEKGAPGLTVGRAIDKMGVRGSLTSEVAFESAPASAVLGEIGGGMTYLREVLAEIRVVTAALALGVARAAMDEAVQYSKERVQFGRPIAKFQAVQAHLAEMAVDVEAARRMTYWAAWRSDQGLPNDDEAAMAKLFASEAALRVCDRAARVLASYGFAKEYPVERLLRDVRFTLIGGGTSEILRINIARGLTR
jgi:butyryl-CoA dehydrogenase